MTQTAGRTGWIFTLLGFGRAGRILYGGLFVLVVPGILAWFVVLPRLRFSEQDELLFRAARHGDVAGVERALSAGAGVNHTSPIDGKTALFRAAIFGHDAVVRTLLDHGADATARGSDGTSALDVALAAQANEKDPARVKNLAMVVATLRGAEPER